MRARKWFRRPKQMLQPEEEQPHRQWAHVLRVLAGDPLAMFGAAIILLFVLLAVLGPWIAPYPDQGFGKTSVDTRMLPPSGEHLIGTDRLGRDLLSRIIIGARYELLAAVVVVSLAATVGSLLGAVAGFVGGWVDEVIMRITDLFLAFPALLLAMAIVAAIGPGLTNAMLALAISWWPWYARLVRGVALSLRERSFVEAARSIGVSNTTVIFRHILPNCISPILVQGTIDIGTVILATGGLAFLGLGAQPPTPDWGLLVNEGRAFILDQWWYSTFPGLAIFITVLAFNLVGDALRDIFDPRQYR